MRSENVYNTQSDKRTGLVAGIAIFFAMAYILSVNPGMFSSLADVGVDAAGSPIPGQYVNFGAIYIATALSAAFGTYLMGVLAKLPLAQASGMGLNAFFVFTVCFGLGFTYANALLFVTLDGILFIVLTATGLRNLLFDALPDSVRKAIPAGIGLFIAFLGFQDSGLVIPDSSTGVTLRSFNILADGAVNADDWASLMPALVTVVTVVAIVILTVKGLKGAVFYAMVGGTALYYLLGLTIGGFYDGYFDGMVMNPLVAFKDFADYSLFAAFRWGFDFSYYLSGDGHTIFSLIISLITTSLAFCMVDMFDTMGTLYGACKAGALLIKNKITGEETVPNMKEAMLSDAVATLVGGGVCGTSTVTTYVESSVGPASGAKDGFAAIVTGTLFLISAFFSPLMALIPSCVYATALVYVGVLMIGSVLDLNWRDPLVAVPAFVTMAMMPFTYNISYGIAFGLIFHISGMILSGKGHTVKVSTWVIEILFVLMFLLSH